MKLIPLSQDQFAIVDDQDYEWLNQYKWHARKIKYTYYARRSAPYGSRTLIYMHRELLKPEHGFIIDHRAEEAARVYNKAAKKHFGEYAKLNDRLPEPDKEVLCFCEDVGESYIVIGCRNKLWQKNGSRTMFHNSGLTNDYVTYWMELPEPPK